MNIGYHAGLRYGGYLREKFKRSCKNKEWLNKQSLTVLTKASSINMIAPVKVVCFSCSRDLPEQVANIFSYFSNLGVPKEFIVASDGSYSHNEIKLLESLHGCISVVDWTSLSGNTIPDSVSDLASKNPLGKKLAVLFGLTSSASSDDENMTQLIYNDSDVLYFPSAAEWFFNFKANSHRGGYLLDCAPSLDRDLLVSYDSERIPLNSGFIIFSEHYPPNWNYGISCLTKKTSPPSHYTEQTVVHLSLNSSGYMPLPSNRFVVSDIDQFMYRDLHVMRYSDLVLRHYVGTVRFKFWLNLHVSIGPW